MKKHSLILFLILFLIVGTIKVSALEIEDDNFGQINLDSMEATKYYKTLAIVEENGIMALDGNSISYVTMEITEEEFNQIAEGTYNPDSFAYSVFSSYKLTAKLEKNGTNYYKYTAIAEWSVIPSNRSYDSIGIGFYSSVRVASAEYLEQYYCVSGSGCTTQTAGYRVYNGTNGSAATYYLPSGTLTALKQTFYVYMEKTNANTTITSQSITASYGHANTSVSYTDAKDFTLGLGGLHYNAAASSYTVNNVGLNWSGSW